MIFTDGQDKYLNDQLTNFLQTDRTYTLRTIPSLHDHRMTIVLKTDPCLAVKRQYSTHHEFDTCEPMAEYTSALALSVPACRSYILAGEDGLVYTMLSKNSLPNTRPSLFTKPCTRSVRFKIPHTDACRQEPGLWCSECFGIVLSCHL